MANKHTVRYEHDGNWWVATVPAVKGCHTQGRSIAQARNRIREALALCLGDEKAEAAELADDIRLPSQLQKSMKALRKAEEEAAKLQKLRAAAAKELTASGLSVRDAGEVLGVSFQRIQQLVNAS